MQIWMNLLLALQIVSALVMIGLVLVQHGKGADMGASFGGGSSGSLFGATGSANFLSRSTAVCATIFFVCTLGLALLASKGGWRGQCARPSRVLRAGAGRIGASRDHSRSSACCAGACRGCVRRAGGCVRRARAGRPGATLTQGGSQRRRVSSGILESLLA